VAAILEWDAQRRAIGNQKALARRLGVEPATVRYVLERARERSST
jgi:DNA-binding transcriptional regulator YdaS (Cro superfamily)